MQSRPAAIGDVPSHWHVGPLRDVLDLITYGFTNPMPDSERGPWKLTAKDVVGGRIRYDTARRTTDQAFTTLLTDKSRPRIGDVLLTKDGSIGRVAVVDRANVCINQSVALLRPNARVHPRYLSFLLRTPYYQTRMEGDSDGSTIKHIYITRVDKMEIAIPPLAEQLDHLSVLGALEDRLDLLNQTNVTIESIAQVLFKSWFIDFDPVRAKAEGREPEGMDAATAALFPAEFEESALGVIPKGWSVRSVDSFAAYLNGLALQKYPPESDDEFLPVIKIAQLRAGHTNGADRASARLKPEYIVRDGDVVFSWSGSLEVELWCGGDGALNQHLFKVTSAEVPKWFYYLATKHFLPSFREIAAHKATTMGHIQRKHLTDARLAMPSASVLQVLSPLVAPLLERRIVGALLARELAAVRDSMLPRLISGKLRMPEAQEQVEEDLT